MAYAVDNTDTTLRATLCKIEIDFPISGHFFLLCTRGLLACLLVFWPLSQNPKPCGGNNMTRQKEVQVRVLINIRPQVTVTRREFY